MTRFLVYVAEDYEPWAMVVEADSVEAAVARVQDIHAPGYAVVPMDAVTIIGDPGLERSSA